MVREFAGWLVDNIDLVLALPLMASVTCLSLQRLGLLKYLRLGVYVSASLSLAVGYAFALGTSGGVAAVVVIAPQTFVLVVLSVVALIRHRRDDNYRSPSPLWIVAIALLGHLWTRIGLIALTA